MNQTDKQALRRAVRSRFPGPEARARESGLLCGHVMAWPAYRRAEVVAGYVPLPWEADITPLLTDVLASGRTLLLPRVEGEKLMTLRRVERLDGLSAGRWGLPEPPEDAEIVPVEQVQLMLVPLEAMDRSGMRLGKGGGYYDTLLAGTEAVTLGAAMSWQWVERVPCEPWDQPLTAAADSAGIHLIRTKDTERPMIL